VEKRDLTRLLGWTGYRVYRYELDEASRKLKLWVRKKPVHRGFECSGCGRKVHAVIATWERKVADLDCFEFRTTVVLDVHRLDCVACGPKVERIEQVPSKAPYTRRFEDRVGQACESAAARRVARQFGLPESTVRAIDLRYLERWAAKRRKAPLKHMGVDEIHMGKKDKFITVVSNLVTGEPLWFGRERKRETLDEFFRTELRSSQRKNIEAACVDMWQPFTDSIAEWSPGCRIIYDKFHILQHANQAVTEVRRAEFFRKGGGMREIVKGKSWLLLTRWVNLDSKKKQLLNELFKLNRRVMKAYLLKEALEHLWDYRYERAAVRYLQAWVDQLRWQRLLPFQKLANMLVSHLDGILNYCRTKVRFGVVEAINGNIRMLINRGRGYKNLRYLLLKAQRMVATKTEFVAFRKTA
jgi:transposase